MSIISETFINNTQEQFYMLAVLCYVMALLYFVKVKVKQSRYRPGVSQRIPGN